MELWKKDSRKEPVITDLDALVPADHLLRKIDRIMDYEWLYEKLSPYYCHDNGRPGTDPVVLIKMVLISTCLAFHLCVKPIRGFRTPCLFGGSWGMVCWTRFLILLQ